MPELLCLGEPMLELNRQPAGPDGRVRYLEGHGGDTSNVAIAAARQGASVGYVTAIGQDHAGDSLLALWQAEGVETACVQRRDDAPTGLYLVTHDASGHRFAFFRAGSAASRISAPDLPEAVIRTAKVLHLSGISQAISLGCCDACFHAIALARGAGVSVSYDTNFRPALWPAARARAVMNEALTQADIAFASIEDARLLTGLEAPDAIADAHLRLGCRVLLLKLGPEGVLVATPATRTRIAGHSVPAVDATGAGDTFAGAYLARHLAGDAPLDAARYANAAAALATTGYGAVAPIPSPAAVFGLLQRAAA